MSAACRRSTTGSARPERRSQTVKDCMATMDKEINAMIDTKIK
jgi:hypothetical protein